ncbi:MAG: T9SS type A sorting domain-containing protein [Bacteroidota bacterium]|nr:T9SS type A sorting domain-containing protein [Bacteroidota bacterium]
MKQHLLPFLYTLLILLPDITSAQVTLPYYSGFDSPAERNGWGLYRTGEAAIGSWALASIGGFSPPACMGHDYSPSSGATLADDWYVSPGFSILNGATLDSIRYLFSGFSVPASDDTIGVFLLIGSQNPANATSITTLADFRGNLYIADNVYRLLEPVALSTSIETAYLAIRYRNADVSSRWLTVRFDNVAISGQTTSVNPTDTPLSISLFPNPCTTTLTIQHNNDGGQLFVRDISGRLINQCSLLRGQSTTTIDVVDLPVGFYNIVIEQANRNASLNFSKN